MTACIEAAPAVGAKAACNALGIARATYYRHLNQKPNKPKTPRPSPPRALSPSERQNILDILHSERFMDKSPAEAYATLLDEKKYLCSIRTMYRCLNAAKEVKERRRQAKHPKYKAPELLATAPNEVWSWDITKLLGPEKWNYYYLYVIMDIYSRYVVGWMIAHGESSAMASRLICETLRKQGIKPGQLTIHADRGPSMKSKPVALLMADLGVTKSHSRPYVSDDNPYSESQFKTLKYHPEFPKRFGSIQDARAFCQSFFHWYNNEHRHWGIGLMTPEAVHHGKAKQITELRKEVLLSAYDRNPERFVSGKPEPPTVPDAAWINKPKPGTEFAAADPYEGGCLVTDKNSLFFLTNVSQCH